MNLTRTAFGWQWYRGSGNICIPAISLSRLAEKLSGSPTTGLMDILRHEYAHAVAHCYPGLIRSKKNLSRRLGSVMTIQLSLSMTKTYTFPNMPQRMRARILLKCLCYTSSTAVRFRDDLTRQQYDASGSLSNSC